MKEEFKADGVKSCRLKGEDVTKLVIPNLLKARPGAAPMNPKPD